MCDIKPTKKNYIRILSLDELVHSYKLVRCNIEKKAKLSTETAELFPILIVYSKYFLSLIGSGLRNLVERTPDLEPLHYKIESGYLLLYFSLVYLFFYIIIIVRIQHLCLYSDSPTFYPFGCPGIQRLQRIDYWWASVFGRLQRKSLLNHNFLFHKGYYSYIKINICVHYLYILKMESWKIFIWPHHTKQFLHVLRSARTKINGGGAGEFFFKVVSNGVRFIVKATHMSLSISCMTKYDYIHPRLILN